MIDLKTKISDKNVDFHEIQYYDSGDAQRKSGLKYMNIN